MLMRFLNTITGLVLFVGAAAMAAMLLAYFAHGEFGLSPRVVRSDALISALVLIGLFVIACVSDWVGRHNRKCIDMRGVPMSFSS